MTLREARNRLFRRGKLPWLLGPAAVAVGGLCALPAFPAPPSHLPPAPVAPAPPPGRPPAASAPAAKSSANLSSVAGAPEQPGAPLPGPLSPGDAIRWALEHNPEIAALRQQHGIAVAGVVIARAYPFNPVWESTVNGAFGPESAGVTNSVPLTQKVILEMEVRGQRKIREQASAATLSRTDWEIANQEVALSVRTLRAFDAVVYRIHKRKLLEDTIALNLQSAALVERLVRAGKLTAADNITIQTEVLNARALLSPGQVSLVTARQELYRALGLTAGAFDLRGGFETPPRLEDDAEQLLQAALERRPDLRARQVAIGEADAKLRLEVANRYGNPLLGPSMEYTEGRSTFVGLQLTLPLPVLNTRRGEIQQREAERAQAAWQLRQSEVTVRQDVRAALARLEQARQWYEYYHREVVPGLEKAQSDVRTFFENPPPPPAAGVDLLRLIDVQRKVLQAHDIELDAAFEMRQALADLAAAVGDPSVAVLPCPNP